VRPFGWVALFDKQRIHYIDRGANVKRGEINIRCPWCGSADPSEHMGINLDTGWYSCWRNRAGHSGKSPLRLLMRLLNVGYNEARELAGLGEGYIDPEGFDAVAARLMGRTSAEPTHVAPRREFIQFDKHFKPMDDTVSCRRWWNYVYQRGFDARDILPMCDRYSIRMARDGNYAMRLILPYFLDGRLVTWTGRAIAPSTIRYKDLSVEDSLVPVKETLFNHDIAAACGRRSTLVLVEGPLDALKVDYYGAPFGVRSVGLSTNSVSEQQALLLEELAGRFKRVVLMMDNKTDYGLVDSMRMKQRLSFIRGLQVMPVPYNRPDPGELKPLEVIHWAQAQT